MALYSAGDLEGAVREYKKYVALEPDSVGAHTNLGVALAHLGRYEEAIGQYRKALGGDVKGLSPAQLLGIRFNLAVAYYKSGQLAPATNEFARLRAAQPQSLRLALLLADCHFQVGEYERVISLLSPLDAANQGNDALVYLLGMSLLRTHHAKEGETVINRILSQGDSPQARMVLGAAALEDLKFEDAMKDFEGALALDPHIPSGHTFLGLAEMRLGIHDKAIQSFRDAIEENPNDFEAYLYLGALLKTDQKYDESLRFLTRALELQPQNLAAEYQLGTLYLDTGKFAAARSTLEEVTKAAPGFVAGHVSLAMVYYRLKDKADGDRERALVQKLNAEAQAKQPAAKEEARGEYSRRTQPVPQVQ
ncbi:MAG: tetratricopeptide repeat protein [Acidobacteriota bacterium]|nr:tetratricopeptide repeat protein [Acidobacteriota bacterium]